MLKLVQRKIAVVSLALVTILCVCVLLRPPGRNEPVYRGRSLTQWLVRLDDGQAYGISSSSMPHLSRRQLEAAAAIRAIGTNALPFLMEDIHSAPSQNELRFRVQRVLDFALARVSGTRLLLGDVTRKDRVRWRAAQGLAALGPLATPAVPELQRLLLTNYFHSSIKEAAYVLAAVGPEGIEILTNAVGPQTEWSGMCAIWALGQHPSAGSNTVPFLIGCASSSSDGTACGAIQVLGLLGTEPELVIPALTNALASRNPSVRNSAAWSLGRFGSRALPILPLLEPLTNDPAVHRAASEAARRIKRGAGQSAPPG
jgi:HEAT repeat protein